MLEPDSILEKVKSIQSRIASIQDDESAMKALRTEEREFAMNYPSIFETTLKGQLDIKQFEYMIRMSNKVKQNKTTQHQASLEVGQQLVDKYVKPSLEKGKGKGKGNGKGRGKGKS